MLLSIIIPQYKEDEKTIKRLLTSIDYQLNVDWSQVEVIIVNDGSNIILSDAFLNSFYHIRPIYLKLNQNVGPGLARQAGVDIATGEYVTFCDADDMYQNFGVLSLYINIIQTQFPTTIRTQWLEELLVNNNLTYITHNYDATWLHGKVINKYFLSSNDIKFSSKLKYHEDSYILSNVFSLSTKNVDVPVITYVWTYDNLSITRKNNAEYTYKSLPEFIDAIDESIEWLIYKNYTKIEERALQLCLYIYYMLQSHQFPIEDTQAIEQRLALFYKKYKDYITACNQDIFSRWELEERIKFNFSFIIKETFNQFIDRICK